MLGYYTKFTTVPENRTKLVDLLLQAAAAMDKAIGCKVYDVALDAADPMSTVVTELWTDETAHDASLQSDVAKTLITQAMPLMTAPPRQIKLGPVLTSWLD